MPQYGAACAEAPIGTMSANPSASPRMSLTRRFIAIPFAGLTAGGSVLLAWWRECTPGRRRAEEPAAHRGHAVMWGLGGRSTVAYCTPGNVAPGARRPDTD